MKTLLILPLATAAVLFTGCVAEDRVYDRPYRSGYYDGGPYYGRDRVVVYDDGRGDWGDRRRRDYYDDRNVDRTNIRERNVYRTNVYENDRDRRVLQNRRGVAYRGQAQPQVVAKKAKHPHGDHDEDHH